MKIEEMETLWIGEEKDANFPPLGFLQYRLMSDGKTCYYQARKEHEPDRWKTVAYFSLKRWQELLASGQYKPQNLYISYKIINDLKKKEV